MHFMDKKTGKAFINCNKIEFFFWTMLFVEGTLSSLIFGLYSIIWFCEKLKQFQTHIQSRQYYRHRELSPFRIFVLIFYFHSKQHVQIFNKWTCILWKINELNLWKDNEIISNECVAFDSLEIKFDYFICFF